MSTKAIVSVVAGLALACVSGGSTSRAPAPDLRTSSNSRGVAERMFYPERGVSCDRATQVCYTGTRADVAQTRAYFGDSAARRVQGDAKDARREPKWVFEPDGDTSCDMRTQVCYGQRGPNVKQTRRYFGDAAAARLEQSLGAAGGVSREKRGVGCDQNVQVCYDENGPNVKQTRKHFGDAAAKKLEKQLRR